jgi:hypothetical protein
MSGMRVLRQGIELGLNFAVRVFSNLLVEQMATRKASRKSKGTRKAGKRALTPWNKLVMKVYKEMKAKDKNVKFGAALKAASKRKSEM